MFKFYNVDYLANYDNYLINLKTAWYARINIMNNMFICISHNVIHVYIGLW
jgi:hypothetical protein